MGESSKGDSPLIPQPGLESGQVVEAGAVGVEGGVGVDGGGHGGVLQGSHRDICWTCS